MRIYDCKKIHRALRISYNSYEQYHLHLREIYREFSPFHQNFAILWLGSAHVRSQGKFACLHACWACTMHVGLENQNYWTKERAYLGSPDFSQGHVMINLDHFCGYQLHWLTSRHIVWSRTTACVKYLAMFRECLCVVARPLALYNVDNSSNVAKLAL